MSRPKPTILLEKVDKDTYKVEQILASSGIWSVFYKNRPINLLVNYPGPKYKKVSFSNGGHAIRLAKKLNKKFNCDDFTVVLLGEGETVYPK